MRKLIARLFSEPLIQFVVLGALLFFVNGFIQQRTSREGREITVDNERVGMMLTNYKTQTGELPTKQQLDAMIESYIREEISYREAKQMGLDKDDEIIRRRLSQKFDFLQMDLTEVAPPSDKDLEQFYKDNPALFRDDARVSFTHIYFSTDNSTDDAAKQKAIAVLDQLKAGNLKRAPEKGDRFALLYDYTDQSALDIKQNFGDKPILQELFNAPVNTWVGPVQSGYGWHLVYVTKNESTVQKPYASVKEEVRTQYMEAEKAKRNKQFFERLTEKYTINRAYLGSQ